MVASRFALSRWLAKQSLENDEHPTMANYLALRFPERAESIADYQNYRVFLGFWSALIDRLRRFYEDVAVQRTSRAVVVFGPQGGGKTMLASRLQTDQSATIQTLRGSVALSPDVENLWHRIVGGSPATDDHPLDNEAIREASQTTQLFLVDTNTAWVENLVQWRKPNLGNPAIVIIDNAERVSFLADLAGLDIASYSKIAGSSTAYHVAAQRFVSLSRGELRGTLFVILTNDKHFWENFWIAVEEQHVGLMALENLPLPTSEEKEKVIRVNTNRLNRLTYWYCLDRTGPNERAEVFRQLKSAETFPASFRAVNRALQALTPARTGRPAKKCILSLLIMTASPPSWSSTLNKIGEVQLVEVEHAWLAAYLFKAKWAATPLNDSQAASMLESEWYLRIVVLGDTFVQALINPDHSTADRCRILLDKLSKVRGPTSNLETRKKHELDLISTIDTWSSSPIDTSNFWKAGQSRSIQYESALKRLFASYDIAAGGLPALKRPDLVVSPFEPCRILRAQNETADEISAAIRRDAHLYEFTAIREFSLSSIQNYLGEKLPNYVNALLE